MHNNNFQVDGNLKKSIYDVIFKISLIAYVIHFHQIFNYCSVKLAFYNRFESKVLFTKVKSYT